MKAALAPVAAREAKVLTREQNASKRETDVKAREGAVAQREAAVQVVESSSIGDGTHQVGVDMAAGTYATAGAGDWCYWSRSRDGSGSLSSIVANDNLPNGGPVVVTLNSGEFFKSQGCGTWTKR